MSYRKPGAHLHTYMFQDLDQLTNTNVPAAIALDRQLELPAPLDEWRMLTVLRSVAAKNEIYRSYIGMGFHDCIVPGVITRNILQNAGWLTRQVSTESAVCMATH